MSKMPWSSEAMALRLGPGERTRGAVDAVVAEFGVPRRRVYDLALRSGRRTGEGPAMTVKPEPEGTGFGE